MRMTFALFAMDVFLLTACAIPALADMGGDCADNDPDISIAGCTAEIQSGRLPKKLLIDDLAIRGLHYAKKGQYYRAMWDFDMVIKLDPRDAGAFGGRAYVYLQYDRAILERGPL
jgi:hypothetical protein